MASLGIGRNETDRAILHRLAVIADAGASFTTIGSATTDPARNLDKLRIVLQNNLSDDRVLIDRVYLAAIPEPTTIGLLTISCVGLIAGRRRSR